MKQLIIENNLPSALYLDVKCVEENGVDVLTLEFYDKRPSVQVGMLVSIPPNGAYAIELNNPTTFESHWHGRPINLASGPVEEGWFLGFYPSEKEQN